MAGGLPEAPPETAVDWSTGEVFTVHPLAARFPLLPDDELADLAADIQAHGLQVPIALDGQRQLIDGRNRLKACERAQVEPRYATWAGGDAAAHILALNVHRRHLTKGAKAMAVILGGLFPGNKRQDDLAAAAEVSQSHVAKAAVVYRYAPEVVAQVMDGASLNDAYAIAQQRKAQQEADARALRQLRQSQPTLAALVDADARALARWLVGIGVRP
jgi:ParB-like chromosome segregation protein Spo0J